MTGLQGVQFWSDVAIVQVVVDVDLVELENTSVRRRAFSTESEPSSHGIFAVPGPNGSPSGLRMTCQ